MESDQSLAGRNARRQEKRQEKRARPPYSRRVVGALFLQLPIPVDVTRGRNSIDRARQRLGGAVFVRVHGRDERFLANLGWNWIWETQLLNCQSALRNGKQKFSATKAYVFLSR